MPRDAGESSSCRHIYALFCIIYHIIYFLVLVPLSTSTPGLIVKKSAVKSANLARIESLSASKFTEGTVVVGMLSRYIILEIF